jgi:hypothetical protein
MGAPASGSCVERQADTPQISQTPSTLQRLIGELRDLQAALAKYDDEALCLRLALMIESRRAELRHRKQDGGRP